ncbi:MAG: hypothetical protein RI992_822, partial [Actinomycetota bacterium]
MEVGHHRGPTAAGRQHEGSGPGQEDADRAMKSHGVLQVAKDSNPGVYRGRRVFCRRQGDRAARAEGAPPVSGRRLPARQSVRVLPVHRLVRPVR